MRRPQKLDFGVGTHILPDGLFYLNFKNVLFHRNTDAWQIYINGAMSRGLLPQNLSASAAGIHRIPWTCGHIFSVFRRNLPGYPPTTGFL